MVGVSGTVSGMTTLMEHLRQTAEAEQAEQDTLKAQRLAAHTEGVINGALATVAEQISEWTGRSVTADQMAEVTDHGLATELDPEFRHVDVRLGDGLTMRVFSPYRGAAAIEWHHALCAPVKLCPYCGVYVIPQDVLPQSLWYARQMVVALEQPIPEHDYGENERCDGTSSWLKLPPEPKRRHRVALVLTPEALEETINDLAAEGYFTPAGITPTPEGTLIVGTYDPMLTKHIERVDIEEEPF